MPKLFPVICKRRHSCDTIVRKDPWAMSSHRQDGDRWTCSCGRKYIYVEDEAEGGGWEEESKARKTT